MNTVFQGTLFDGETLEARPVVLQTSENRLRSITEGVTVDVAMAELRTSDRLASIPRFLYLPDNRTIATPDNDVVDALLAGQKRGKIVATVHWLEARAQVAAAASLLLLLLVSATLWWGLPVLARKAAQAVPPAIETKAGETALLTFNQILRPSHLNFRDRNRAEAQVRRLIEAGGISGKPQLIFRSMGGKSPNAFALPGGFIVISDELIELPVTDDELAAVLAHEIGHWQLRHGLQSILRGSTALLLVSTVTGDLSTLTTFAGSIPFVLLQRGYSREFESEADDYAVGLLLRAKIDVGNFSSVLEKLENARPETGKDFTYLSTHPGNAERIRRINPTGRRPAVAKKEVASAPKPVEPSGPSFVVPDGNKPDLPDGLPRAREQVAPIYPLEMSLQRINGQVTVEFIVDPSGDTRDCLVVHSSDRRFEAAALAAVAKWKYFPGRQNGKNVPMRASIKIEFDLNQPATPQKPPANDPPKDSSSSEVPPVIPLEP